MKKVIIGLVSLGQYEIFANRFGLIDSENQFC